MQTAFKPFSPKQKLALRWWALPQYQNYDAIICDGAVRSGKTVCMSLGFVCWATTCFQGTAFALCGKTITALRRNVVTPLLQTLQTLGFSCTEKSSRNYVEIALGNRSNRFYLFGGKDESSAALIQGITLGGVFLDEVALMPRTFVEQALARCSLHAAKMWFNCNPRPPLPLVLSGMDSKGSTETGVISALHHGRQSGTERPGSATIRTALQRYFLRPLCVGKMDGFQRCSLSDVL